MPRFNKAQIEELLWQRGNLDFKLRDYQEVIEELYQKSSGDSRLFVLNCARRFGKTYWLVKKAVEAALNCPNIAPRIKLAASTASDIKEFIVPAFEKLMEGCPEELWPGWEDGYMKSEKKFIGFPNGAEIQLVGLDRRPDAGRGNHCDWYGVDEAGYVDTLPYIFSSVVSPMFIGRDQNGWVPRFIVSSTPSSSPAHPFQDFCERAKEQNAYVELNIEQNKSISPEERDRIRREDCLSESDWLREYMCQHVVDEDRAITPEFARNKHIIKNNSYAQKIRNTKYYGYLHRYVGMDLGVKNDFTVALFATHDPKHYNSLIIEDEYYIKGPQMTTEILAGAIKAKEKALWGSDEAYLRISDSDNPLLINDLSNLHELFFRATSKQSLHRMVNKVRVLLKEQRIYIHPRCKQLIGCLEYGIWDKNRKRFETSPSYGHFDALAALIYLVHNWQQRENPIPSHYLIDTTDPNQFHRIELENRKDQKRKNLYKKALGLFNIKD